MFNRTHRDRAVCLLTALIIGLAGATGRAGQADADLFSSTTMQKEDLPGISVWLGQPVPVTAQLGWKIGWPKYEWEHAFTHLTPTMARFPKGELIATYTLDSDTQSNPVFASGYQISKDGGVHWGRRCSMLDAARQRHFHSQAQRFADGAALRALSANCRRRAQLHRALLPFRTWRWSHELCF